MAYIFQSIFALEFKSFLVMVRDAGQQTRGYEAETFPATKTYQFTSYCYNSYLYLRDIGIFTLFFPHRLYYHNGNKKAIPSLDFLLPRW